MPATVFKQGKQMAQIFDFPASHSRAGGNAHTMSGSPGEVVLFPGVRYERANELGASTSKKRPAQRRDRLELED